MKKYVKVELKVNGNKSMSSKIKEHNIRITGNHEQVC